MLTREYPKDVTLKDGRRVVLRPLEQGDFDKLYAFFGDLPEEDRLFLRHDVSNADLVRRWTEDLDFKHIIPLVAVEGGKIVADGTLHLTDFGWMQHVGHIRLVTARTHRHSGLGTLIARELVALAKGRNLEKLQAHVIEDNAGAVKMFQQLGFETVAVLKDLPKDQHGKKRNLAIMLSDVVNLGQTMEDWIQDSMIPAFRVPGGQEG
jgi:ribosomal protein S18 acetylase RimI-like enzyme